MIGAIILILTLLSIVILVASSILTTGRTFFWQSEYYDPDKKRSKNPIVRFFQNFFKG